MFDAIYPAASVRKVLLFGAACCRPVARYIRTEAGRRGTELAERKADGPVPEAERKAVLAGLNDGSLTSRHANLEHIYSADRRAEAAGGAVMFLLDDNATRFMEGPLRVYFAAQKAVRAVAVRHGAKAVAAAKATQAKWMRCVFGNPFRPVAVDPSWLTLTVVALADAIYADRAFDRMPILADALEEAGCDQPDILSHCRGDGPHVRGCWVVEAILGRS